MRVPRLGYPCPEEHFLPHSKGTKTPHTNTRKPVFLERYPGTFPQLGLI